MSPVKPELEYLKIRIELLRADRRWDIIEVKAGNKESQRRLIWYVAIASVVFFNINTALEQYISESIALYFVLTPLILCILISFLTHFGISRQTINVSEGVRSFANKLKNVLVDLYKPNANEKSIKRELNTVIRMNDGKIFNRNKIADRLNFLEYLAAGTLFLSLFSLSVLILSEYMANIP